MNFQKMGEMGKEFTEEKAELDLEADERMTEVPFTGDSRTTHLWDLVLLMTLLWLQILSWSEKRLWPQNKSLLPTPRTPQDAQSDQVLVVSKFQILKRLS